MTSCCCLNQTSIGPRLDLDLEENHLDRDENHLNREEKATRRERESFCASSTGPRSDEHNQSTGSSTD